MPAPGVSDTSRRFAVVVHDVAPAFLPQLARIAEALAPRVGRELAGAAAPCWHGRPIEGPGGGFGRFGAGALGAGLPPARRPRPATLPWVVVDPAEVDRGSLRGVLEVVDRLVGRGRAPGLLSEFLP